MSFKFTAHIRVKIIAVALCPLLAALAVTLATLLYQQRQLARQTDATVQAQAREQAAKIAQSVYLLCAASEQRTQRELTQNLQTVHDVMNRLGKLALSPESATWTATNQLSNTRASVELPKVVLGSRWLGQSDDPKTETPLVDEVKRITGQFCTVFQRMNEQGDMLRVATSVRKADGARAIGTYIPARNPDGAPNAVISAVLRGETFRGRAYVVNSWHAAAYEPIWDDAHQRVVGMLYVGIALNAINQDLRDVISRMVVG